MVLLDSCGSLVVVEDSCGNLVVVDNCGGSLVIVLVKTMSGRSDPPMGVVVSACMV